MGNNVFANGREVSCKAADGKSICAFPDVCMTPPENPATPPGVPVPYPNTGLAKDATSGSKKVKVSGKEVMLRNKSYFKTSTGDEAGCAAKKGVVTSKIKGKIYFTVWSMDVKFEGENVVRHMDLTTHNHGSTPGNTIPWLYSDTMDPSMVPDDCRKVADEFNDKCGSKVKSHSEGSMNLAGTNAAMCDDDKCREARTCILTPYNLGCCDGKTPHHVVPKSQFKASGKAGVAICSSYVANDAPCICEDGTSHSTGKHGDIHEETNNLTVNHPSVRPNVSTTGKSIDKNARWKASDSYAVSAEAVSKVESDCDKECIEAQTRKGHENMGISPDEEIRPTTAGRVTDPPTGTSEGY